MAHKTFDLPELLEMILLELDLEDLQISRGVCMQWNEMWKSSIRIQRRLFLAPAKADDKWVQGYKISPNEVRRLFEGVDVGDAELHKSICEYGITLHPRLTFGLRKSCAVWVGHFYFDKHDFIERQMYLTQPPLRMETWEVILPETHGSQLFFEGHDSSGLKLGELCGKVESLLEPKFRNAMSWWECSFVDVNGKSILE